MGLTIHYGLTSKTIPPRRPRVWWSKCGNLPSTCLLIRSMTKFSISVPKSASGPSTIFAPIKTLFSTVLDGCKQVDIPWHRKQTASVTVQPLEIFSFSTIPGPGSEWASFGLARYPAEIEVTYCPRTTTVSSRRSRKGCSTSWQFDWKRWERWLERNGHNRWEFPEDEKFQEKRKIKTRLGSGWRYSTSARLSMRANSGIPNFVRCHLCVIHLLDRIAALPTMKVEIDDEGKYGRSYYTDDPWAEERVYTWHDGKYDVKALVRRSGRMEHDDRRHVRAINDMLTANGSSAELVSPITAYPDFEHLEFKGQQNHQYLAPFLQAMKQ